MDWAGRRLTDEAFHLVIALMGAATNAAMEGDRARTARIMLLRDRANRRYRRRHARFSPAPPPTRPTPSAAAPGRQGP